LHANCQTGRLTGSRNARHNTTLIDTVFSSSHALPTIAVNGYDKCTGNATTTQGQATHKSSCSAVQYFHGKTFQPKLLWPHSQTHHPSEVTRRNCQRILVPSGLKIDYEFTRNKANKHCGSIVKFFKHQTKEYATTSQAAAIPKQAATYSRRDTTFTTPESINPRTDQPLNRPHCTLGSSFLLHTRTAVRNLEANRAIAPLVCQKQLFPSRPRLLPRPLLLQPTSPVRFDIVQDNHRSTRLKQLILEPPCFK
jgi:hypothetical protein